MPAIESLATDPPPDSAVERGEVLDYVRARWRVALGEAECEDAVAAAYVALLERIRLDAIPPNRIGWLKKTAWRIANDAYKRNKRWAAGTGDGNLDRIADGTAGPAEHVDLRDLDGRLKEAYNQLPKPLRLALASEFADRLTVKDICKRLRCRKSTLMHRRMRARQYLYGAAIAENERFDDEVIEMMIACLTGTATPDQRRRVQDLKARSPYYAARFVELRTVERRLPAIVVPIFFSDPTIAERATAALGSVREAVGGLVNRSSDVAQTATSPAIESGAGKVSGAAAGGLGGALSSLGGAKLVVGCLSGAAAASACVVAVVGVPHVGGESQQPAAIERSSRAKPAPDRESAAGPVSVDVGTEATIRPQAATAQPVPPTGGDASGDGSSREPKKPTAARNSSESDFSFGGGDTAAGTAAAGSAPTTSSSSPSVSTKAPTTSTSSDDGGGSSSTSGGDFAFGSE